MRKFIGGILLAAVLFPSFSLALEVPQIGEPTPFSEAISPYLSKCWPRGIEVLSPNGGEIWQKGKIYKIRWTLLKNLNEEPSQECLNIEHYMPKMVRMDLIKSDGTFVRHIVTTRLNKWEYSWRIPYSIPSSDDYKIRIRVWPLGYWESLKKKCKDNRCPAIWLWVPHWSDESDRPFSIVDEPPLPPPYDFQQVISLLEDIAQQLNQAISLLTSLLRS